MPKTNMQEHSPAKVEVVLSDALVTYVVAKAVKEHYENSRDTRRENKVKRDEMRRRARQTHIPQPNSGSETRELNPQERKAFQKESSRLHHTKSFIAEHLGTPSSLRKVLPRDGVYHSPWAYHHHPSYGSLHFDQSEFNTPEHSYQYASGMERLVALGKKPLQEALAKSTAQNPNSEWMNLLSRTDLTSNPGYVKNASSAHQEKNRIVGLFAAIEGMGFDTSDLAFANWEDKKNDIRYKVVPYDPENVLHKTVAARSLSPIQSFQEAGLMLRYVGSEYYPEDISVDVRAIDINALRIEKGEDIIPQAPNPRELASRAYRSPQVLPSTGIIF